MAPAPVTLHARCAVAKLGAGEVLFVGQTSFAPGLWVGVQLDAPNGKNDGSVQGKRYFHTQDRYGVFVRPSQLEMAPDAAPASAPRTQPRTTRVADAPEARARTVAAGRTGISAPSESPTAARSARIGALRKPAGASPSVLQRAQRIEPERDAQQGATPTRTARPTAGTPSRLQTPGRLALGTPRTARGAAVGPARAIGTPGSAARVGATPGSMAAKATPLSGTPSARAPSATPSAAPSAPAVPEHRSPARDAPPLSPVRTDTSRLRAELAALQTQLEQATSRASAAEARADAAEARAEKSATDRSAHDVLAAELTEARTALAKLTDEHESAQTRLEELTEGLEMATLDREMAEEKAENLEHELQTAKDAAEELQLELQLHQERASQEAADAHDALPVEQAQLVQQNARLKEALVRLRDTTRENDSAQKKEIASLRAEAEATHELQSAYTTAQSELAAARQLVDDLRAQAELAQNAEEMLEELTERNGALDAQVEQLTADIHELETLRAVSDELEETHLDTEAQLQAELSRAEDEAAALRAEVQSHATQLADCDATLHQFRELVREQFRELEELRGRPSHQDTQRRVAVLDSAPSKAHLRAISTSLEQLVAAQSLRHLDVIKVYLPPDFWAADEPAVATLLVLERIARLSALTKHTLEASADVQDRYLAHTLDEPLLTGCKLRHALAHLAALAEHVAAALSTAPPDVFIAHARHAPALAPAEQQLRHTIETLQHDTFDEQACAAMCDALVPQLESVSMGLQAHASVADLAAKEAGSATLASHDVDTLLAGTGLVQQTLAAWASPPLDLAPVLEQLSGLVGLARRARVPARNLVRRLAALRTQGRALAMESVPALPGLGQLSSTLAARASRMAQALVAHAHAVEVHTSQDTAEALEAVLPHGLYEMAHDAEELAATLDTLHLSAADPENAIEIDDPLPWHARAAALHAAMQENSGAERRAAALSATVEELQTALRTRDDAVDAAAVKVERLKFQLDKTRALATSASDLRAHVESLEAQLAAAAQTPVAAPDAAPHDLGDVRRALRTVRTENQYLRAGAHLAALARLPPLAAAPPSVLPSDRLAALRKEAVALVTSPHVVDVTRPACRASLQYAAQVRKRDGLAQRLYEL